jgi:hypothetical protein
MNNPNVFDLMDTDPSLSGFTAACIFIMCAIAVVILQHLKEAKEMKGPFDGY